MEDKMYNVNLAETANRKVLEQAMHSRRTMLRR